MAQFDDKDLAAFTSDDWELFKETIQMVRAEHDMRAARVMVGPPGMRGYSQKAVSDYAGELLKEFEANPLDEDYPRADD